MSKEETKETKETIPSKTHKMPSRKQIAFIENYLLHFNGGQAYSEVYGVLDPASAGACASRLLKDVAVQRYLNQRLEDRRAELHIDQNYVVRKLMEIVEADFVGSTQYLTEKQINEIPKNIRKLIQSIEKVKTTNSSSTNSGDYENTTEKFKVTFMSKDLALQSLGKHTGAFMKDNINANINMDQMTFSDALKKLDI